MSDLSVVLFIIYTRPVHNTTLEQADGWLVVVVVVAMEARSQLPTYRTPNEDTPIALASPTNCYVT